MHLPLSITFTIELIEKSVGDIIRRFDELHVFFVDVIPFDEAVLFLRHGT